MLYLIYNCDFGQLTDSLIKDGFVSGINDKSATELYILLTTPNLTTQVALEKCRAWNQAWGSIKSCHTYTRVFYSI